MFSEHQEISNEINEATDPKIREDLERELEALVSRMEAKSQQISKVRKHQQKVRQTKISTTCLLLNVHMYWYFISFNSTKKMCLPFTEGFYQILKSILTMK